MIKIFYDFFVQSSYYTIILISNLYFFSRVPVQNQIHYHLQMKMLER